jgi:hypothetical protein
MMKRHNDQLADSIVRRNYLQTILHGRFPSNGPYCDVCYLSLVANGFGHFGGLGLEEVMVMFVCVKHFESVRDRIYRWETDILAFLSMANNPKTLLGGSRQKKDHRIHNRSTIQKKVHKVKKCMVFFFSADT